MGYTSIKLTEINEDNCVDTIIEMEKFVGENQTCLIAYKDATMFVRMMEIETKLKYFVERPMCDSNNSPIGKGFRYYLPECDLYLELIIYNTGVMHIECLKDMDDDTGIFVTKFKIEIIPCSMPVPVYLKENKDTDDENIQKLLYWIQKGFGELVDLREIFRMK